MWYTEVRCEDSAHRGSSLRRTGRPHDEEVPGHIKLWEATVSCCKCLQEGELRFRRAAGGGCRRPHQVPRKTRSSNTNHFEGSAAVPGARRDDPGRRNAGDIGRLGVKIMVVGQARRVSCRGPMAGERSGLPTVLMLHLPVDGGLRRYWIGWGLRGNGHS